MDKTVFLEVEFLVLILFSLLMPICIYAYMARKKAIWRRAIKKASPNHRKSGHA